MSDLRERLLAGKLIRLFGIGQLANPKLVEMLGIIGGYDGIWIDLEHAGCDLRQVEQLTLACRARGLAAVARVELTDYARVMRPLEAGAVGVMGAQVRSVDDGRNLVRWTRFWPAGQRGINGGGVDGDYGMAPLAEYAERANRQVLVAAQIETIDAIEALPQLVGLDGIDLFFVGPSDLAQALGVIGQFDHPRCMDTIEYVARVCVEAGKRWGIVARTPDYAEHWRQHGCTVFLIGNDLIAFREGIRQIRERYEGLFG